MWRVGVAVGLSAVRLGEVGLVAHFSVSPPTSVVWMSVLVTVRMCACVIRVSRYANSTGSGLSVSSFLFHVPSSQSDAPVRSNPVLVATPFLTPKDPKRRRPLSCFVLPDFVLSVWVSLLDHLLFVVHLHPSSSKYGVR
jgi:hypothetical protein